MRAKVECKECGGIQDATRNLNDEPIYKCRCCDRETPRRVNHSKKREAKQAEIKDILASLIHFD